MKVIISSLTWKILAFMYQIYQSKQNKNYKKDNVMDVIFLYFTSLHSLKQLNSCNFYFKNLIQQNYQKDFQSIIQCFIFIQDLLIVLIQKLSRKSIDSMLQEADTMRVLQENTLLLQKILSQMNTDFAYSEKTYDQVMKIMSVIRNQSSKVQLLETIKEGILIIGTTGYGKSTLLNYLKGQDLYVNQQGSLYVENSSVKIGDGSGSTTLLPNIEETKLGIFFDLAGDMQTRGLLADIFNNLWKSKLKLQRGKIILVVPQSTFGAAGSYGQGFKEMIEKNSKLLRDINKLKQNSIMVLSFASRSPKGPQKAIQNLKKCLNHPDQALQPYRQFIEFLLEEERILPFCVPGQDALLGSIYDEPEHNPNQKQNILQKIDNMKFSQDIIKFEVSSTPKQREALEKLFKILKSYIDHKIEQAIQNRRVIHGIQLRKAYHILENLKNSFEFDLQNNRQWAEQLESTLNENNLFKCSQIFQENRQLVQNIDCIVDILKASGVGKIRRVKFLTENAAMALNNITQQVHEVMLNPLQDFRKVQTYVQPLYPQFETMNNLFDDLKQSYNRLSQLQISKNNLYSQYYQEQSYQEFVRTKQVAYMDQEVYLHPVTKYRIVAYNDTQEYTDYRQKNVIQPYQVKIKQQKPVTKYRNVYRQTWEPYLEQKKKRFLGICVGVKYQTAYRTKAVRCKKSYIDYEQVQKQVTKYRNVTVTEPFTNYRTVTKTKPEPYQTTEIRTRQVQKTRQVPVYQRRTRRNFIHKRYNQDQQAQKRTNDTLCEDIAGKLIYYNNMDCIDYTPSTLPEDETSLPEKYQSLLRQWQRAQACCYKQKYPTNRLK